jgi:hypothetical protein
MAEEWLDPLEVEPPRNVLVEVAGIPAAGLHVGKGKDKQYVTYPEWRAAAFMGDDGEWYLPEVSAMKWTLHGAVFFNEVYRWRDLTPCKDCHFE